MIYFEVFLLILLIACALAVALTRELLPLMIIFMMFSLIMSVVWIVLESPDLAITEAAVGAGITSLLFFLALRNIHKATADNLEELNKHKAENAAIRVMNWVNGVEKSKSEEAEQKLSGAKFNSYGVYVEEEEFHKKKKYHKTYNAFSIFFAACLIVLLIYMVIQLPAYGDPHAPVVNEVSTRYVERGLEETGATNIVAGLILDYRAFDTFGEAAMLFTASIVVISLLKKSKKGEIEKTG